MRCHGRGRSRGGFSIETRELLLKGGDDGPAVVLGKSAESHLIAMVAGLDPDEVMPKKGSRLTSAAGGPAARLDRSGRCRGTPTSRFAKAAPRNLARGRPSCRPTTIAPSNPVDRLLAPYFAAHETSTPPRADDRTFIRRASLDIVGLLPSPVAGPDVRRPTLGRTSASGSSRACWQDDRRYAEHWLTFLERPAAQRLPGHRLHRRRPRADHRAGSMPRWRTTCRTTSSSRELVESRRRRAKASPRASSGAAWSTPARRRRCRRRRTSRRCSWA